MNRFDYVQFNVPQEAIIEPNEKILSKSIDVDGLKRYCLTKNGLNVISKDDIRLYFKVGVKTATIGISAKILGSSYPELINRGNFDECIRMLSEKYKLCKAIDLSLVKEKGIFNRLEITHDIKMDINSDHYTGINRIFTDSHKWNSIIKKKSSIKSGFGVMKNDSSESILFYNKEIEMKKKNSAYAKKYNLEDYFNGFTRIEARLNTKKSIKNRFNTNNVNDVLGSTCNPNAALIDEVFATPKEAHLDISNCKSVDKQRDRERLSYANEFDQNINLISEDLKKRNGQNWKRPLTEIVRVINSVNPVYESTLDLLDHIKKQISLN